MEPHQKLLLANKAWIIEKNRRDSGYFAELSRDQSPEFLWIGCSDSRVPAEEITRTKPGDVFVHRNVGNLVHPSDTNLLSVVEYGLNFLHIDEVIICGHVGCGAVRAALTGIDSEVIHRWIEPIKKLMDRHADEIAAIPHLEDRLDHLVKLSVKAQVETLCTLPPVRKAIARGHTFDIHGWMFDLRTGQLKELVSVNSASIIKKADSISRSQAASAPGLPDKTL